MSSFNILGNIRAGFKSPTLTIKLPFYDVISKLLRNPKRWSWLYNLSFLLYEKDKE